MRAWLMLLAVSCTRPNPLFFGEASEGASSGVVTAGATSTSSATEPVPTTSSTSSSTGSSTADTASSTEPSLPACQLSDRRVTFDPPLPMNLCPTYLVAFALTSKNGDVASAKLCQLEGCQGACSPDFPLGPDLSPLVTAGKCYRIAHQGQWVPGDPEAPGGCKTTALAVYNDGELVYPLYAGFSRLLSPPPTFLDPNVALAAELAATSPCACGQADCCMGDIAETYTLKFTGAATFSLDPGVTELPTLKGVPYAVSLLRAQTSGARDAQQVCVPDPELQLIDWQMVSLAP